MAFMKQKKQVKDDISWSEWINKSLSVLKPPEKLTVTQWADKYRILDAKTSAEPGQWNTSRTPYLKGIMDAFTDIDVEEITFVKPTQVGGTECLNNILGYIICQDQGPTLIVYPTLELAEYTSKNRIQQMIHQSPSIEEHYRDAESKILELQFDGMYVVLSGANSPASLASRPIRYLLFDEKDKFPKFAGKEADPASLAKERTKTFVHNKKIFNTSTPTLKNGPIWQDYQNADSKYKYYVPCPHCGVYQDFKFKQIKWPEEAKTPDEVQNSAYYQCEECKGIITDFHKAQMIKDGEWRAGKKNGKKRIAFHLNAIYSPWVRFGDVAYEFKKSKDYPELLMNFVNSWLAEPWEQTEVKLNANIVNSRQSGYEELIVPDDAILLTGGIDVQKDYFYYTIRAWGYYMTSWNIAHGICENWPDLEYIMNLPYKNRQNQAFQVNLSAIDSGDQTDVIYDLCAENQDWLVPVKGASHQQLQRYKISSIDKVNSKAYGMRLYIVDTNQYKDMIAGRLNRANGKGSWMVYQGCDQEYAEQITAEEKVREKRGGRDVYVWKPKSSSAANHYLDCEVYAAMAADLLQVRYLQPEQEQPQPQQQPQIQQNNFLKNTGSWIKNKGSWIR